MLLKIKLGKTRGKETKRWKILEEIGRNMENF